jgi:protein gp37
MAENTAISWATHTFNPWMGCTKVSPACDGCYAEALMDKRYGKVQWGPHGERVRTAPANWKQPIKWSKQAENDRTRPFVFCASLADVFDNQVPAEWREDLFDLIRVTPNLVYLLLTKRPQNIVKMVQSHGAIAGNGTRYLPRNAAIGTTIEDQKRADVNVPALIDAKVNTGALFTFLSCEPLLGPIDLTSWIYNIDWVITGGETDQGSHRARPTHPEWFRSLRDQCAASGAPYHHKQNGEWLPWIPRNGNPDGKPIQHVMENGTDYYPGNFSSSLQSMIKVGKNHSGRMLDGVTHDAFPEVR